jgi:hypothetical protein
VRRRGGESRGGRRIRGGERPGEEEWWGIKNIYECGTVAGSCDEGEIIKEDGCGRIGNEGENLDDEDGIFHFEGGNGG